MLSQSKHRAFGSALCHEQHASFGSRSAPVHSWWLAQAPEHTAADLRYSEEAS